MCRGGVSSYNISSVLVLGRFETMDGIKEPLIGGVPSPKEVPYLVILICSSKGTSSRWIKRRLRRTGGGLIPTAGVP